MGSSTNNAAQQNQAANQQIQQNTQAAQAALQQYLMGHPSILSQAPQSIQGAQQFGGVQGGGQFGGATGGPVPPQGAVGVPPQAQRHPQAQQPAPPPQLPPGLLALLMRQQ